MEEDYDEYDDEYDEDENSEGFVLSIGDDGKAKVETQEDFNSQRDNQQELVNEFIRENLEGFKKFLDKKGISEDDFNKGLIKHDALQKNDDVKRRHDDLCVEDEQ